MAMRPEHEGGGGIGLFRDNSHRCKVVFGKSPSAIIDDRPETDLAFLKILEGKEHLLHKLATKDLQQRTLSADTGRAADGLSNITSRIQRRVLQEILERCMYLHYWTGKHVSIASKSSWDELLQRATQIILDQEITPHVLRRFPIGEEVPKTWVELAILQAVGEQDLAGDYLQEALDFHRTVSSEAAAHLNLLGDNTYRTPWTAAKLLSTDPARAKGAASVLAKHLAKTRPGNRTLFEEHLLRREDLWKNLEEFSQADPAVLLWHDHGKYESLFKFLAPRFLLAPDHVLDAERIHARWQWSCQKKGPSNCRR